MVTSSQPLQSCTSCVLLFLEGISEATEVGHVTQHEALMRGAVETLHCQLPNVLSRLVCLSKVVWFLSNALRPVDSQIRALC